MTGSRQQMRKVELESLSDDSNTPLRRMRNSRTQCQDIESFVDRVVIATHNSVHKLRGLRCIGK